MTSPSPGPFPQAGRGARAAILAATTRFGFSATPRLDAELLMAHAMGCSREALLLGRLDNPVPAGFAALVERRGGHEPVAYIVGTRAFWTIDLQVAPGVLIPRADSETLIEAAVAHFAGMPGPRRILDLGTGSGALLLAALDQWPDAVGVGIDASLAAVGIAQENARRLGMAPRADIRAGGWHDGAGQGGAGQGGTGTYDLILCNPPYIETSADLPDEVVRHEPAAALFAGADGLADYRVIAPLLRDRIAPGGAACIEIGATQGPAVAALIQAEGLDVAVRRDLAGHARCLVATHPGKAKG